jgi:hypothetical protein
VLPSDAFHDVNFEDLERLIPGTKPDDLEDVAWALQTASTMWNRGENAEAIKWVRRAAEAAYEGERDERGLELTKAAADIAAMITRRSQADQAAAPPATPNAPAVSAAPPTGPATGVVANAPPPKPQPQPPAPPPPSASKAPPAPNPPPASKPPPIASRPPPAVATVPTVPKPGSIRPGAVASVVEKKPAAPKAYQGNSPSKPPVVGSARGEPRRPRKSGTNFTEEAKSGSGKAAKKRASRPDRAEAAPALPPVKPPPGGAREKTLSTTEEWDAFPTQTMAGDDLDEKAERTRIDGTRAAAFAESPRVLAKPNAALPTNQAVRVVIWQDVDGVHVAPQGTVVSAITADALLVALDPSTDLAAWLSAPKK